MATLEPEKQKHYGGQSIVEYVKNRQKWRPCGISRSAIVESYNSWGGGGEEAFQHALDRGLIVP